MPLIFACPVCKNEIITSIEEYNISIKCPFCSAEPSIPDDAKLTTEQPNHKYKSHIENYKSLNEKYKLESALPKHVLFYKQNYLDQDEDIIVWALGYIGEMMGKGNKTQHNGVLIITNNKVIFYKKGLFTEVHEEIPIKKITSIERKTFLGHRTLRMHTSHDQLEFKFFDRAAEQLINDAIEKGRVEKKEIGIQIDPLDALKKLAELKDAGIISEQEFIEKKAILLSKL